MKTTNLRIGNLVQDNKGIVQSVDKVWGKGAELSKNKDIYYRENEIFGVPITPECIVNFNFSNELLIVSQNTEYKYVHQLQNLYHSITGKELQYNKNN